MKDNQAAIEAEGLEDRHVYPGIYKETGTMMLDITAPRDVQIQIRRDSKVIWIHIDGETVLRVCRIGNLEVDDARAGQNDDNGSGGN